MEPRPGSSGLPDTALVKVSVTSPAAYRKKTRGKSDAGSRSNGMSRKSRGIVKRATSPAASGSGKHCCTGPTIVERFERAGSWSHPQELTTEEWWADVLADPRPQIRRRRTSEQPVERTFYRLADEPREVILIACSKCEWKAAYQRAELIAAHGAACPMPSLLERLAAPRCPRLGSQWDRCGVHYVEPVEKPAP
jgi:hypothetical protein